MPAVRWRAAVDAAVGLLFLCWFLASLQLPYGDGGRPGPGAFPLWLSLAGMVLSTAVVVNALRPGRGARGGDAVPPDAPGPVPVPGPAGPPAAGTDDAPAAGAPAVLVEDADSGRVWRPLGGLAGLVGFFLLVPVIGFLASLVLLLLYLCLVLIRMKPLTGLAVTLGTAAFVYAVFYLAFGVPFPNSLIGV
ncbi:MULTISPECIES: tripartite tricarboxylate transporter TctB family protein [unclassified Nocardiopsis]|uniref:tripartite tricarboxylate transporter TctB family protein n=1 Tax=unclassified Nocardiopsis TaxID=2649073 RepID=UPI00135A5D01|nr:MULTISPECIES: tripartite tricarboxylate transporter TctB family protein [unclassified Nocardiopsis]